MWGQLAALGLGAAGGAMASHRETKYRRLARSRGQRTIDQRMRPLLDMYFNQQMGALQSGRQGIEQGYDQAIGEASRLGRASMREAKEAGFAQSGALLSGQVARGARNTSQSVNFARAVQGDVSRRIQGINEGLIGARAGLYTGRGQALAAADAGIAGAYGQRAGQELNLENLRYGLLTGYQPQAGSVDFGGLASLADSFAGMMGGGGMGGGGYWGGASTAAGGAAGQRLLDRYGG